MQKREDLGKLAKTLEGIPVWGCLPGSVAQAAGIQYGDVVMAVNGRRTRDLEDYLAARGLRQDGAEVVVFRNGEERTVQLIFTPTEQAPDRLVKDTIEQVVQGRMLPVPGDGREPDSSQTN